MKTKKIPHGSHILVQHIKYRCQPQVHQPINAGIPNYAHVNYFMSRANINMPKYKKKENTQFYATT